MHAETKQTTVGRFSIVDVTVDILLIATALLLPIDVPSVATSADTGFLQSLGQVGLLFICYFGIALYVARMYYASAVKSNTKWHQKVLQTPISLMLFTGLFVINILVSAYNILQTIAPPVFTSLLIIVEGLLFGFTFGLDYAIERHRAADPKYAIPSDNAFSQSLSFFAYLLLTILLVYPLDYISLKWEFPVIGRIITLAGSCLVVYLLSGKLNRTVFSKLQLTSQMNLITVGIVSTLMILGFMGLDVLEVFSKNPITISNSSIAAHLMFLVFFGIVPIRIGTILFSRTSLFNRVLGVVALSIYLLVESDLLQIVLLK
jgi:hypothetical protein